MDSTLATLEDLSVLRRRVLALSTRHLPALKPFHPLDDITKVKDQKVSVSAFSHLFPTDKDETEIKGGKVSITSTVTCIKSLYSCPDFKPEKNADYTGLLEGLTKKLDPPGELTSKGLDHGNPFTVGLLLPILKIMNADPGSKIVEESIRFATEAIRSGGVSIRKFPENGYVTYWVLRGLHAWGQNINEFKAALGWSKTEFYRQLSLFSSGADEESDAYQLGYNFLIQFKYQRSGLRDSVIKHSLKTLFDAQLSRGVWEKKDPLFVYGENGDAYCFTFELLTALLAELKDDYDLLADHEDGLEKALYWAERNKIMAHGGEPTWRSGHRVDDTRPESWATAEVYLFLDLYRTFLSQRIQSVLLDFLKGTSKSKINSNDKALNKKTGFYLPTVKLKDDANLWSLDELLKERLLEPLRLADGEYSLAKNIDPEHRVRSGILFGPPGTGKTTFVKRIAEYLGWPLIILDPGDFAQGGIPLIPSTTTKVFKMLLELEDVVIFFDEMEELIRHRTGAEAGSFEQKFLTTSFLPKLQNLHDRATCMFFVATNFHGTIDPAARREGRFDFQIQILPPSFEEKLRMLSDSWSGSVPADVLGELKQDDNKERLEWATRSEMKTLIEKLKKNPDQVRNIVGQFKPNLLDDQKTSEKYKKEAKLNIFSISV